MAPSAYSSTSATWAALEMPRPTQVLVAPASRSRPTRARAAESTSVRAPVMPMVETA